MLSVFISQCSVREFAMYRLSSADPTDMAYKLSYFPIRGLAEPIRMLLADQGIAFDDERISKDEWPKHKSRFYFGQMPCLFDGDEQICQSGAILRHLARKHGLVGSSESETTFADMFCEGVRDFHSKYTKMIYTEYEEKKDEYISSVMPVELEKLEKLFKTYQGGEKFVLGDKISYADYMLFEELDVQLVLSPTALDKTPLLKAFHDRMNKRSGFAKYLEKRAADGVPCNGNGKQ